MHDYSLIDWWVNKLLLISLQALMDEVLANATNSSISSKFFRFALSFMELSVVSSLLDIDECSERPDLCQNGVCRNLAGTYICDCDSGYVRSADGKECEGKQRSAVIIFRL